MLFSDLLVMAKNGSEEAKVELLEMYKPLFIKNAIVNGRFNEDLYQELCETLLKCIICFQI